MAVDGQAAARGRRHGGLCASFNETFLLVIIAPVSALARGKSHVSRPNLERAAYRPFLNADQNNHLGAFAHGRTSPIAETVEGAGIEKLPPPQEAPVGAGQHSEVRSLRPVLTNSVFDSTDDIVGLVSGQVIETTGGDEVG